MDTPAFERLFTELPVEQWQIEQVMVLDWYDSPLSGFCKMLRPDAEFYFKVFATRFDENDLDDHLYSVAACAPGTVQRLVNVISQVEPPRKPLWVPFILLSDDATQQLDAAVREAASTHLIVQSRDMRTITNWWLMPASRDERNLLAENRHLPLQNIFSEDNVAARMKKRAALARRVEAAFADTMFPDTDQFEWDDEIKPFAGQSRWQDVPLDILTHNPDILYLFSPKLFHFYFPAYLRATLLFDEGDNTFGDTVVVILAPSSYPNRKTIAEHAIGLFTKEQKAVILEFLRRHEQFFPKSEFVLFEDAKTRLQQAIQFWEAHMQPSDQQPPADK